MNNMVVKLGVFLVTTALGWAAVTKGERSPGHILDPKEIDIRNAEFSEMTEEEMDFENWNMTLKQHISGRLSGCGSHNPCNPNSMVTIYHKSPVSCEKYIKCFRGRPYCAQCDPGFHFSETPLGCYPPKTAGCTVKSCEDTYPDCHKHQDQCGNNLVMGIICKKTCKACEEECKCGEVNPKRIIGGSVVPHARKYPWMVGLQYLGYKDYFCGGSIINDKWILTAAHCVVDTSPGSPCNELFAHAYSIKVVVGDHIQNAIDPQGIKRPYGIAPPGVGRGIVPHHNYNCFTKLFDVALIELDTAIVFDDNIRPICLPKHDFETYDGETGIATGWGIITNSLVTPRPVATGLKEVELKIRANNDCGKHTSETNYGHYKGSTPLLSNIKLCAGGDPTQSTCGGDSGGPLIVLENNKYVQVGIVSYGKKICAHADFPLVFTRVSKVLNWITDTTKGAKKCN